MNAEDLSLVTMIVGNRGGNKTLLMTHFIREALNRAWMIEQLREKENNPNLYPRKKVNIYSNYPVISIFMPPGGKKPVTLRPETLDLERLIQWAPEFRNGYIFFDEIDQAADRQDWMSTVQKLLTAGAQMLRHRNLSMFGTIQSFNWLNSRLMWQTDIVVKCRDLCFSNWGREQKLEPGEIASTVWIDKSGIMTGRSFDETGQFYPLLFFGKRYWGSYDPTHDFDILAYKRKYKLSLETRLITDSAAQENDEKNRAALHGTIEYFSYNQPDDLRRVRSPEFWEIAKQLGFNGDNRGHWGRYLRDLGITKRGGGAYCYYDISGVEPESIEASA